MTAYFLSTSPAQMIENTFPVVQVKARFLNGLCFLDYTTRATFVCQFDPPKMDSGLTGSSSDVNSEPPHLFVGGSCLKASCRICLDIVFTH